MTASARKDRFDLSTTQASRAFNQRIGEIQATGKRPIVQILDEKRTLEQNDMFHALYQQLAAQIEDQSFKEIRQECKLRHGVPIMRRDDEKFRELYDRAIKSTLSYEEKLAAMEYLPVTSLMGKKQGSEYIDEIIRLYSKHGYSLIHPSEADYL